MERCGGSLCSVLDCVYAIERNREYRRLSIYLILIPDQIPEYKYLSIKQFLKFTAIIYTQEWLCEVQCSFHSGCFYPYYK